MQERYKYQNAVVAQLQHTHNMTKTNQLVWLPFSAFVYKQLEQENSPWKGFGQNHHIRKKKPIVY